MILRNLEIGLTLQMNHTLISIKRGGVFKTGGGIEYDLTAVG